MEIIFGFNFNLNTWDDNERSTSFVKVAPDMKYLAKDSLVSK